MENLLGLFEEEIQDNELKYLNDQIENIELREFAN